MSGRRGEDGGERRRVLWIVIAALVHAATTTAFALAHRAEFGVDFRSYAGALEAALAHENPFTRAQAHGAVVPFFYPPPFLLFVAWAAPLSRDGGAIAMLVLNEALLGATLFVAYRWLRVPLGIVALVLGTFTPLWFNLVYGQANLLVALALALAFAWAERRPEASGALLGAAAMLKMSPCLLLLHFVVRREWRALLAAAASALGLSLASLVLVPYGAQRYFYSSVLPDFARGTFPGLPISVGSVVNYSIAGVFARLFPGEIDGNLSPPARIGWGLVVLGMIAAWAYARARSGSAAASLAALSLVMFLTPTIAWEYHLVMIVAAVLVSARDAFGPTWIAGYACLVAPIDWLLSLEAVRLGQRAINDWVPAIKVLGVMLLFVGLLTKADSRRPRSAA